MSDTDKLAHAREQGKAQYESILEMMTRLRVAQDDEAYEEAYESLATAAGYTVIQDSEDDDLYRYGKGGDFSASHTYGTEDEAWAACCEENDLRPNEDDARQAISDDPLSVEVRSGWQSPGGTLTPSQFNILLCTGGPACRIIGELDEHGEPYRAWMEVQDWGTSWTQYFDASQDVLLEYARCFYFGEG
jgi:hypothetical protein